MSLFRRFACAIGSHDPVYVGRGWRVCPHCRADLRIGEVERNGHRSAEWFNVGKYDEVGTPEEIATVRAALALFGGNT